jgi:signal transduction histidine kinase
MVWSGGFESMTASPAIVDDLARERLRIARELHDVIAYGFAAISLQAGVAVHVAAKKPQQAVEALQAITIASNETLEELRGILGLLRQSAGSRAASFGLERFEVLVEMTSKAGVPTSLDVFCSLEELPVAVGRAAYRIVQEALANVLRHAGEASATVTIAWEGAGLAITVEDDGVGPGVAAEPRSAGSGFGLIGMRERTEALGGALETRAGAAGGFVVDAYLPFSAS